MWTNIDIERKESLVGKLPRDDETWQLSLPDKTIIPGRAREILVYAWVWIGTDTYPQSHWHYKIFVDFVDGNQNKHEAAFYLFANTDPGVKVNSFAINSDNVWLPMPSDRTLKV